MNDQDRYERQENSFPHERRKQTFIAELGGGRAGFCSTLLKTGAAAAGVDEIWADYHGSGGPGRHWLLGNHEVLTRTVNADVVYDFLDPEYLREDLQRALDRHENSWVVAHANDPAAIARALEQIRDLPVRVVLPLAAPGGVVVQRHPNAETALEQLRTLPEMPAIPAGTADLAAVAAGFALNEIILGGTSIDDDLEAPRTVAFYSLNRPRRINVPGGAELVELVVEIASPLTRASFSGRRLKQVGAGALGNWTALALALDGGATVDVIDGDQQVESHNLNRQVLLVRGLGRRKAEVLTGELQELDPAGRYTHVDRFVDEPADLEPLDGVEAVIMAPDNDAARLLGADVAWSCGVPYGVGGTGVTGGQVVIQQPHRACFRCITGLTDETAQGREEEAASLPGETGGNSCARANSEAIVASNMIVGGILVAESREALSGRRTQNLRLFGNGGGGGNRLGRMTSDPECSHHSGAGSRTEARSVEA